MLRIALAATAAAVVFTAGSSFGGVIPAKAENLKMAQVEIDVGRDRNVHEERRDRREPGATVGVGPGGIVVGPREHCRMVTTTVERDDGRRVTRKERVCD
jgi:predicted amino acid dehydrogenase